MTVPANRTHDGFDHSSDPRFFDYYSEQSLSPKTLRRFRGIRDNVIRLLTRTGYPTRSLEVLDVGCGAGTGTRLWTELGHRATGLDTNGPLIELARKRAEHDRVDVSFEIGSATGLPFADESKDVCVLPELLEHVVDWQGCLNEAVRVLRPGGALYVSTTNVLNPMQDEFELPLYSWYPGFLKRRYERLAVTTRPELVNHAKYPAVHWFTFFGLKRYLNARGMQCIDHFEVISSEGRPMLQRWALSAIRTFPPLKWLGLAATPATRLYAVKTRRT
jgi:2-polyprenyl-6-hydroxyphenyl methylase/3-demethylubiquinone-9 3-methyltransferase